MFRGIRLGPTADDVLCQRHPWNPRTPSPAKALAQDDPSQPWAECGCFPQAFPAPPGNHKSLLKSIFGSAEIMKNKVRVLEHRPSVFLHQRLEGSGFIDHRPLLFRHHADQPIRGLGGPEKLTDVNPNVS